MPDRHRLLDRRLGVTMIQPHSLSHADVAQSLALFRQKSPLIHCMTNDVVQTFTATCCSRRGERRRTCLDAGSGYAAGGGAAAEI